MRRLLILPLFLQLQLLSDPSLLPLRESVRVLTSDARAQHFEQLQLRHRMSQEVDADDSDSQFDGRHLLRVRKPVH